MDGGAVPIPCRLIVRLLIERMALRVPVEPGENTTPKLKLLPGERLAGRAGGAETVKPAPFTLMVTILVLTLPVFLTVKIPCCVEPTVVLGKRANPPFETGVVTEATVMDMLNTGPSPTPLRLNWLLLISNFVEVSPATEGLN